MPLPSSGELKLSDLRTEYSGSGEISLGDLYRGGSLVRGNAANNSSTNLSADVPTSGQIKFDDFYSQAAGFRKTYSAGATNQNASTIFGDDYGVDYPKEIVINSGVELGATTTGEWALEINSGGSGDITVTNNGTLTGKGGGAGAGGGDAVRVNSSNVTIDNTGTIRGGGGGGGTGGNGGNGGTGGQGRYQSGWGGFTGPNGPCRNCPSCPGGYSCWLVESGCGMEGDGLLYRCRQQVFSITSGGAGGSGGSGGAGGAGAGYQNNTADPGSSGGSGTGGAAGGPSAGAGGNGGSGGSGGNGGDFGAAGSNGSSGNSGSSGSNGNYTNGTGGSGGSSGGSGGAAGRAVQVDVSYTMNNTGTIQGAYT